MNIGTRPFTDIELKDVDSRTSSLRDAVLIHVGSKTGFRISELLSIKISDVLEYGKVKDVLTVLKSQIKGKVSSRSIPLSDNIKHVIQFYISSLPTSQVYLFQSKKGKKLSRIQAWRIIKQFAINNKLKGKIATHSLRKYFAQKMYEKLDKDIVKLQKAMGHKSINSTVSYVSFLESEIDEAIRSL